MAHKATLEKKKKCLSHPISFIVFNFFFYNCYTVSRCEMPLYHMRLMLTPHSGVENVKWELDAANITALIWKDCTKQFTCEQMSRAAFLLCAGHVSLRQ